MRASRHGKAFLRLESCANQRAILKGNLNGSTLKTTKSQRKPSSDGEAAADALVIV